AMSLTHCQLLTGVCSTNPACKHIPDSNSRSPCSCRDIADLELARAARMEERDGLGTINGPDERHPSPVAPTGAQALNLPLEKGNALAPPFSPSSHSALAQLVALLLGISHGIAHLLLGVAVVLLHLALDFTGHALALL